MPVKTSCQYLGVSRSGYYKHLNHLPSNLELENEVLRDMVREIFLEHKGRYGGRRIQFMLKNKYQLQVSRRRIGRLLHKQGLYPRGMRRKYRKSISSIMHPNLVNQDFQAKKSNQIWFGDITYIPTQEGTLYCSVYIDCYTRKLVGYSIKTHMRDSLVIESLEAAIEKENPKPGLIIHTDCGSQYTGYRFYEAINQNCCVHSHSRKGNPYDNALMESFYRSFKREVFPDKRYQTRAQALLETLDYLESYYNEKRIHSSLNYQTPNDFARFTNSA